MSTIDTLLQRFADNLQKYTELQQAILTDLNNSLNNENKKNN